MSRLLARSLAATVLAVAFAGQAWAEAGAMHADSPRSVAATVLSAPIYADELDPSPAEMTESHSGVSDQEWVAHLRARRLEARIVVPLERRFCVEHACEPTKDELRAVRARLAKVGHSVCAADEKPSRSPKLDDKTSRASTEDCRLEREMTLDWVSGWKLHKTLYRRYGGEVIMQVMGPNAVGARRSWLEDEEARGRFHIVTPELRADFYKAVSAYGGNRVSAEEADEIFAHPPWERRSD